MRLLWIYKSMFHSSFFAKLLQEIDSFKQKHTKERKLRNAL